MNSSSNWPFNILFNVINDANIQQTINKSIKTSEDGKDSRSQQTSEQKHEIHKLRKVDVLININTFESNRRNLLNSTVVRNEKRRQSIIISHQVEMI